MTQKRTRVVVHGDAPSEVIRAVWALDALCESMNVALDERDIWRARWHDIDAQLTQARTKLEQLQSTQRVYLHSANTQLAELRAELAAARGSNLPSAMTACAEVTTQRDALLERFNAMSRRFEDMRNQRDAARTERDDARSALNTYADTAEKLRTERDNLATQLAAAIAERDEAQAQANNWHEAARERAHLRDSANYDLRAARAEVAALLAEVAPLRELRAKLANLSTEMHAEARGISFSYHVAGTALRHAALKLDRAIGNTPNDTDAHPVAK